MLIFLFACFFRCPFIICLRFFCIWFRIGFLFAFSCLIFDFSSCCMLVVRVTRSFSSFLTNILPSRHHTNSIIFSVLRSWLFFGRYSVPLVLGVPFLHYFYFCSRMIFLSILPLSLTTIFRCPFLYAGDWLRRYRVRVFRLVVVSLLSGPLRWYFPPHFLGRRGL